jgi:hypothetical protein
VTGVVSKTARTPAILLPGSAIVWALAVHAFTGMALLSLLSFISLAVVTGMGLGYGMADGGLAVALFLTMAVAGVVVSSSGVFTRVPGSGLALVFGTAPALMAALGAHAGGELREGRPWR